MDDQIESDNDEDPFQNDDEDDIWLEQYPVAPGANSIHQPLVLPKGRKPGREAPLPYSFLMRIDGCKCGDFFEDNFVFDGNCCAGDSGQFWEYLKSMREVADGTDIDSDSRYHLGRDPNVNYRYKMYAKFCQVIGISGMRKELPTCYVNAVREIWPSANGSYVGFKFR
jgi:hypothetical protein